jgi:DNA-binding transcriptional LysR family regulator
MAGVFDSLTIFVEAATPLVRPNHGFSSITQLSRRARANDDKLRRTLTRLSDELNDPLIGLNGRRLALTEIGRQLLDRATQLLALAKRRAEENPVEVLKVATGDGIDSALLADVVSAWMNEWQGLGTIQFRSLPPDLLLEQIAAGLIDLGIGWAHAFPTEPDERIEPAFPLMLLVPRGHALSESLGAVDGSELAETERVFLSPAADAASVDFLGNLPPVSRVAVDTSETLKSLVERGGLGLDFTTPTASEEEAFVRRPVVGVEPATLGVFFAPGRVDARPEPVKFFVDAVRRAVVRLRSIAPTPPLTEEANPA